ncbi:MAG: TonB-dependent receptor [Edaphobacter sp.]
MNTIENVSTATASSRRSLRLLMLLIFLTTVLPLKARAQLTVGHITGTVKDTSGASVSGATVTLTNNGTSIASSTSSTSTGTYTFELVNPGAYTLHVEAPGFSPQITHGVQVHIQQTVTQDYTLSVGDVTQQVTVTSETPMLQAEDAAVGQTVDTKAINDLPLVGRDWTTLAHLAAGTTTAGTNGAAAGLTFSANGVNSNQNDIRLDGIDDNMEFYGASGTISIQATTSIVPPPDAIQEFRLQTGDLSAAFGHSTGSVINAVVKSGSDQFHGDLWEYIRNDAFNANDYFTKQRGASKPRYHENQYGGTIGGPVRIPGTDIGSKKTFFFFDTQRIRIITPRASTATVPTDAMRNSGFTNMQDLIADNSGTRKDALGRTFSIGTILDPTTTRQVAAGAVDPVTGLQNSSSAAAYVRDPFFNGGSIAGITNFVGRTQQLNNIPSSRIDPNAVRLLNLYPSPTSAGFLNDFYYTPSINLTLNQYDIRIDHNINDSNLLWGVFNWYHAVQTTPGNLPGLALGANYGAGFNDSPHYAVAVNYTHIFTPTLTNSLSFGLQSSTDNNLPPNGNTPGIPAQFGIQGVQGGPGLGGLPTIKITNLTSLGAAGYNPITRNTKSIEVLESLTKSYRNHTFTAGYELTRITAHMRQPTSGVGAMTFDGGFSDIPGNASGYTSIADMLLIPAKSTFAPGTGLDYQGGVNSFVQSNATTINNARYYNALYFQDDWKALPNLTLNLGLRWDHYGAPIEVYDRQANMIGGGAGNGPTGTFFMPTSTCNQATPQFLALLQKDGITQSCTGNRSLSKVQNFNFAPRVGFAYRIRPDFVVRAGYGIAYGSLANIGAAPYVIGNNFPFAYSVTYTAPSPVTPVTLSNGALPTLENVFASVNLSSAANVNPFGSNLAGRQFNFQTPYTQTFNLTLQKQIGPHDSVQAAYVGNVGRHIDSRGTYNVPSVITPPGTNNFKYIPFPDFAIGSAYLSTNAVSSYNSLQTVYTHQFSAGLSVLANYTFSKCMTNQGAISDGLTYRAQWLPGLGIDREYTLCPNDAKQVIHAAGSYDLPIGRGRQFMKSSNAIAQATLGGWAVNYIVTYQSGQPFTIPCPIKTTSYFGCNANKVAGVDPAAGAHTQQQWLNPKAFSNPAVATQVGQSDYSVLGGLSEQARGPSFTNIDASVFKEFPIKDAVHLQFRAEAYNLFNHAQFGNPTSNLDFTNVTKFSQITALRNQARILQLALKLYY